MLLLLDGADRVVAVNERYLERTGYHEGDVVGRHFWDELLAVGSRVFYQTQLAPILQLDRHIDEVMVELSTADGPRLPALMNVSRPEGDGGGGGPAGRTAVALMSVPDRRAFETRLRQARDAAEEARRSAEQATADAEQARRRLELLAQADAALASSLDVDIAMRRLAHVLTDRLADWCVIYVSDADQSATLRWSATHTDPAKQVDLRSLAELLSDPAHRGTSLHRVLDGGPAVLVRNVTGPQLREFGSSDDAVALCAAVGLSSLLVVPVSARQTQSATIVIGRGDGRTPFDNEDLADISDVAARTGIVIDNVRRQAREHSNSVTLQHALLTTPPVSAQFDIATRYLPATNGNEVGGDWYDALLRPDGTLVTVIGDVVGHDIHAAAAMGQLRGIIRTIAYTTGGTPAEVLTRTDTTSRGLSIDLLATALIASLATSPTGETSLTWSSAGHLPPIRVTESGASVLEAKPDPLLGLPTTLHRPRHDHIQGVRAGDLLVFYTDGLVERPDESIDRSIAALAERLPPAGAASDLDDYCERLLRARTGATYDDVALIVLRVGPTNVRAGGEEQTAGG